MMFVLIYVSLNGKYLRWKRRWR